MTVLRLSPARPRTMYYRVTWTSALTGRREYADYRYPDIAEIVYTKIRNHIPGARPTLGPVIV